ncbi:hypothetical protein [Ehrlichia ruminantium]|nr:hypothetical protein [Ehrlichia ruminantium]UOD97665.1 hypothetical protein IMW64_03695 [Ehrlichia ruminantium]
MRRDFLIFVRKTDNKHIEKWCYSSELIVVSMVLLYYEEYYKIPICLL